MSEPDDKPKTRDLGHSQDLQMELDTARALPTLVIPLFAVILTFMCLFMAAMLFGSGNMLGGFVFSLILVPASLYIRNELRTRRERRDALAAGIEYDE